MKNKPSKRYQKKFNKKTDSFLRTFGSPILLLMGVFAFATNPNFLKEAFGIFYVLGIILLILIAVAAFVDKDRWKKFLVP